VKESALFEPIKQYFEQMGYTVDGEVKDCDMLMVKDEDLIAIELKNDLNFKLFIQAAKRQKLFDHVYVAVWLPKHLTSKSFRDKVYLLNRLGIGLITVSQRSKHVEVFHDPLIHPLENYRHSNKNIKLKTIEEFQKRRSRNNVGGVNRKKVMTSYKEDCLIILNTLQDEGRLKASLIKEKTGIDRAYTIVYKNHYGWFVKEGKGIYTISKAGFLACKEYEDTIKVLTNTIEVEHEDENRINERSETTS